MCQHQYMQMLPLQLGLIRCQKCRDIVRLPIKSNCTLIQGFTLKVLPVLHPVRAGDVIAVPGGVGGWLVRTVW